MGGAATKALIVRSLRQAVCTLRILTTREVLVGAATQEEAIVMAEQ